jgi:hypothetical protein
VAEKFGHKSVLPARLLDGGAGASSTPREQT